MKSVLRRFFLPSILFAAGIASAGPSSHIGATPLAVGDSHHFSLGWPSVAYEWWHSGEPDWAIGGEIVYGDWSGDFSEVDLGLATNVPFRWRLNQDGAVSTALKLTPGAMIGYVDAGPENLVVFGLRGEVAVPITIELNNEFSLITGGSIPFTLMFQESADAVFIIPTLARIGVEMDLNEDITPWALVEMGPIFGVSSSDSDADFAIRAMIGTTF